MKERWNRKLLRVETYEEDPDNPFDFGDDYKEESDRAYRHQKMKTGFAAFFISVMLFTLLLLLFLLVATLADLK